MVILEDKEKQSVGAGILVLNVVKDYISKRKAKNQVLIEKYKELHQPPRIELKTLLLIKRIELASAPTNPVKSGDVYQLKTKIRKKQAPTRGFG